ncbi:hypothetical protein D3C81_635710 [compost metagenome]
MLQIPVGGHLHADKATGQHAKGSPGVQVDHRGKARHTQRHGRQCLFLQHLCQAFQVPVFFARTHTLIERGGALDIGTLRLDPHRLVAHHHGPFEDRRDIGANPIVIAIAATVLDDAHPALAVLEVRPHVGKHRLRHVRVTDDIVRAAQQFVTAEATDGHQLIIAVGQVAVQVGGRNQPLFVLEDDFLLGDRQIASHALGIRYCGINRYPHCRCGN